MSNKKLHNKSSLHSLTLLVLTLVLRYKTKRHNCIPEIAAARAFGRITKLLSINTPYEVQREETMNPKKMRANGRDSADLLFTTCLMEARGEALKVKLLRQAKIPEKNKGSEDTKFEKKTIVKVVPTVNRIFPRTRFRCFFVIK